ncbi:MAG: leucine-rich repeat protein [Clostridia bacterium]|nr:leucine-rich repeat protein [Clostridia bacterium]
MKKWMIAVCAVMLLCVVLFMAVSCTDKKTENTQAPLSPTPSPSEAESESVASESAESAEPSQPAPITVERISCSHEQIKLIEGETLQLSFEVLPENAENKELLFSVEPAEIASYENGVLTALKSGTAVLRVSSADEGTAVLELPIEIAAYVPVTELRLDPVELTLAVEESCTITCTVLPENATKPQVTWQVHDPSVVRFENGTLTALKQGTTLLTAQSTAGCVSASLQITVTPHENHRMGKWEVVFPASCTEVGMQIRYCEVCHTDYYEYEAIDVLAHEYGEIVTLKAPTKEENGLGEKTCAVCQGKEELVLRVTENEISYGKLGDEIEYSLYSDGELYIRGDGQFYQWDSQQASPLRSLQGVKKVFFCGNVELISDNSFEGLKELEQVVFKEGLKMIGNRAFYGCSSLKDLALPKTLQFVGSAAFAGCARITSVEFSSALLGLGQSAFEGCKALETVVIGENVTSIGSRTFAECVSLTDLTLRCTNLKEILSETFLNCRSLKVLTLPECVQTVERSAFAGCTALKQAELSGCTGIQEEAFSGCTALEELSFTKALVSIWEGAFEGCTALKTVRYSGDEQYFNTHVLVRTGNEELEGKWLFNA